MKKIGLLAITAFIMSGIAFTSCDSSKVSSVKLKTQADSVSFILGQAIGSNSKKQMEEAPVKMTDAAYLSGFYNGWYNADDTLFLGKTRQEAGEYLDSFFRGAQIEENAKTKVEGEKFLLENKGKDGVITTPSGLQYKIITEGKGIKPIMSDTVVINYMGKLLDGREFDSTYSRGVPTTWPLMQFIPGWIEGLQLMEVGSKYMFWIPTELAYGENPPPQSIIKPNSVLEFEIELLDVIHEKK